MSLHSPDFIFSLVVSKDALPYCCTPLAYLVSNVSQEGNLQYVFIQTNDTGVAVQKEEVLQRLRKPERFHLIQLSWRRNQHVVDS